MLRALLFGFGLAALLVQTVVMAHPFAVHCFNSGGLVLKWDEPAQRPCCKKSQTENLGQKVSEEIRCCAGFDSSFEATLVERVREVNSPLSERGDNATQACLSPHWILSQTSGHQKWATRSDPPPVSPSAFRSRLGIWTC